MTTELVPLRCWICGVQEILYYILIERDHTRKFDTRPANIGSTERVKTMVCNHCGTTVIEDKAWETIESSS